MAGSIVEALAGYAKTQPDKLALADGKAEFSSHEKLLEENSAYRELYQLQDRHSVVKATETTIEKGAENDENRTFCP